MAAVVPPRQRPTTRSSTSQTWGRRNTRRRRLVAPAATSASSLSYYHHRLGGKSALSPGPICIRLLLLARLCSWGQWLHYCTPACGSVRFSSGKYFDFPFLLVKVSYQSWGSTYNLPVNSCSTPTPFQARSWLQLLAGWWTFTRHLLLVWPPRWSSSNATAAETNVYAPPLPPRAAHYTPVLAAVAAVLLAAFSIFFTESLCHWEEVFRFWWRAAGWLS
jgi:hypothetical protein